MAINTSLVSITLRQEREKKDCDTVKGCHDICILGYMPNRNPEGQQAVSLIKASLKRHTGTGPGDANLKEQLQQCCQLGGWEVYDILNSISLRGMQTNMQHGVDPSAFYYRDGQKELQPVSGFTADCVSVEID